ncbi:hypothetical protein GOBAR_DD12997 [Gossypium barbadense]|nr:hypothetical protein GOBAR_DD12997 [Gossypium barbadense]
MTELFFKKGNDKTLDNFIPKSESDFVEYAELISHRLCPYEMSLTIFLSLHCHCIKENGKIAVKEKKSSKKRPRGLKNVGSMESDSG